MEVSRAAPGDQQRSARWLLVFLHVSNAERRALSSPGSAGARARVCFAGSLPSGCLPLPVADEFGAWLERLQPGARRGALWPRCQCQQLCLPLALPPFVSWRGADRRPQGGRAVHGKARWVPSRACLRPGLSRDPQRSLPPVITLWQVGSFALRGPAAVVTAWRVENVLPGVAWCLPSAPRAGCSDLLLR